MPLLAVPALALAALLAVAGAAKVLDPTMTVGALRAMGLPSSPVLVRAGAAAELVLGVCAIAFGGQIAWLLVALSYISFGTFTAWALRRGTPLGSCGCFGRPDTPPHPLHLCLDLALGFVALEIARALDEPPLDAVLDHGASGVIGVAAAAGLAAVLYLAFTRPPPGAATR